MKIDLTNKQCENFKVINRNIEKKGKNVWWNCQCKCGKMFTATTTDINRGIIIHKNSICIFKNVFFN